MKKVLVAGGAGFIGSHLVDDLLKEGYEVVGADNLSLGTRENIEHLFSNPNFHFEEMDFADLVATMSLFDKYKFDIVYHLVANSDIRKSSTDPTIEYRNTFLPTYNIMEAMRMHEVKKIFFSSTSAIYGDKVGIKIDEDLGPLLPISYYGGAKLASEGFISAYAHMNDIEVVIFRFPNVIGSRLTHGVVYDFIAKLKNNPKELEILGNGKQSKPYLHVSDLIEGINLVMKEEFTDLVNSFNIGVSSETTVDRIADIICQEMGLENVKYLYTGGDIGWKGDVAKFQYDLTKITKLGWQAKYDSDKTVKKTVQEVLK